MPSSIFSDSAKQIFRQPGHTIYLLPTVVVCNLLPCELEFYVKGMPISGTLKPGKEVALHTADTSQNIELGKKLYGTGNAGVFNTGCTCGAQALIILKQSSFTNHFAACDLMRSEIFAWSGFTS